MAARKLKVLMLGWEFPPQITGGLGTACEGLTHALSKRDVEIHFLMPTLYGNESAPHLSLYDVRRGVVARGNHSTVRVDQVLRTSGAVGEDELGDASDSLYFHGIPSFLSPYLRPESKISDNYGLATGRQAGSLEEQSAFLEWLGSSEAESKVAPGLAKQASRPTQHYGGRLFEEVEAYGRRAAAISDNIDFDLIHAHDWMTFPGAIRIKQKTGKPVILHVHSLESDRAGAGGNPLIGDIERYALRAADSVIAVSHYTKRKIMEDCGIPGDKIFVVHNGIIKRERIKRERQESGKFNVLFLGRVTFQKGPDYFVEAALKVLKQLPQARFILAGTGDMLDQLRARIHQAGAEKNFYLPGFLRGREVDEAFANADLYVMPSVSEPFGISVLEALYHDVPVIVSRQSGVSEVIQHSLKADFWDVDELTDLMVGALKYPELRRDLLQMARQELDRLDWDASATRVAQVYCGFI